MKSQHVHENKLINAIISNEYNTIELLLKQDNFDINSQDIKTGRTPLHYASDNGNIDIVNLLLEQGGPNSININATDIKGDTPLHLACFYGHGTIVQALIHAGANINSRKNDGSTPLHSACHWGEYDVIKILVNNGANITIQNKKGKTPAQLALETGNSDIADYLEKKQLLLATTVSLSSLAIPTTAVPSSSSKTSTTTKSNITNNKMQQQQHQEQKLIVSSTSKNKSSNNTTATNNNKNDVSAITEDAFEELQDELCTLKERLLNEEIIRHEEFSKLQKQISFFISDEKRKEKEYNINEHVIRKIIKEYILDNRSNNENENDKIITGTLLKEFKETEEVERKLFYQKFIMMNEQKINELYQKINELNQELNNHDHTSTINTTTSSSTSTMKSIITISACTSIVVSFLSIYSLNLIMNNKRR